MQNQVKEMTWNNMMVDAADAKFKKLMKDNGTLCAKYCGACTYDVGAGVSIISACLQTTVLSKNGKLTVTGSPRIARKKGQRQRPRAERTIRPLK